MVDSFSFGHWCWLRRAPPKGWPLAETGSQWGIKPDRDKPSGPRTNTCTVPSDDSWLSGKSRVMQETVVGEEERGFQAGEAAHMESLAMDFVLCEVASHWGLLLGGACCCLGFRNISHYWENRLFQGSQGAGRPGWRLQESRRWETTAGCTRWGQEVLMGKSGSSQVMGHVLHWAVLQCAAITEQECIVFHASW